MFKYMHVFKILRQTIVEQSEVEMITLMEVKTQEQVLKLFSACVALFLFKEMNKIQDLSIRSAATSA